MKQQTLNLKTRNRNPPNPQGSLSMREVKTILLCVGLIFLGRHLDQQAATAALYGLAG